MKIELKPVRLKSIREQRGMKKSELARLTGMQGSTIGWIETGRFIPYESQLQKLADVLGVSDPEELLEEI